MERLLDEIIPTKRKEDINEPFYEFFDNIDNNYDNALNFVSEVTGVNRKFINDYILKNINRLNEPLDSYLKANILQNLGFRKSLGTDALKFIPTSNLSSAINQYKTTLINNNPGLFSAFKRKIGKELKVPTDKVNKLHISDDDFTRALFVPFSIFMRNRLNDIDDIKNIINLGGNPIHALSQPGSVIDRLWKRGFTDDDILKILMNRQDNSWQTEIANVVRNVPDNKIATKLLTETPTYKPTLNYTPIELLAYSKLHGYPIHPNLPRGSEHNRRLLAATLENMNIAPEFRLHENTGADFSANSIVLLNNAVNKLSKSRIKTGRFPGLLYPKHYNSPGNSFANVNLGTLEEPKISDHIYGETPSIDAIRTYPNRKEAENTINLSFAKVYKQMLKDGEYGISKSLLDDVIKAGGNVDAVPNARALKFNEGNPIWSIFEDTKDYPIYPGLHYIFKHGGKINKFAGGGSRSRMSSVQAAMQAQKDKEEGIAKIILLPEVDVFAPYNASDYAADKTVRDTNIGFKDPLDWRFEQIMGHKDKADTYEKEGVEAATAKKQEYNDMQKYLAASAAGSAAMTLPFLGAAALGNGAVSSTVAGINKVLTNPYVDAVLTADMANEARKDIVSGNVTPMTALEVLPFGRLAKPIYKGVVQPGMELFNSPLTGNWIKIGNREYRFKPGYLGMNGTPIESRAITEEPLVKFLNAARQGDKEAKAALKVSGMGIKDVRKLVTEKYGVAAAKKPIIESNVGLGGEPWIKELPIEEGRYYRQVGPDALDSYKANGVVSQFNKYGNNPTRYEVPMFTKGKPSLYREETKKYGDVWVVSKPKSNLEWESVNGAAVSPKYNGEFNSAPISEFDFYQYDPAKGYVKLDEGLNLPNGINFSRTPHIDYLNGLSEQQQIEYLTQNGLNDQWLWTLKNNPDYLENALSKAPIPNISTPQITTNQEALRGPLVERANSFQSGGILENTMSGSSGDNTTPATWEELVEYEQQLANKKEVPLYDYKAKIVSIPDTFTTLPEFLKHGEAGYRDPIGVSTMSEANGINYTDYEDFLNKSYGDWEEYDPQYHGKELGLTFEEYINNQLLKQKYNGMKNPIFIGGSTNDARYKYFQQHPELITDIKEISKELGVPAQAIASRLAHEGFVDDQIAYNNAFNDSPSKFDLNSVRAANDYKELLGNYYQHFGLDLVGSQIYNGEVTVPEKYKNFYSIEEGEGQTNERGEEGRWINLKNNKAGIVLMAARMAADAERIKKDFPNADESTIATYLPIYYNRANPKQYILNRLKNGKSVGYATDTRIADLFK